MFSKRLKDLRIEYGYTQADLAKFLELEAPAISKYELGLREPSLAVLNKLSEIFNVSIDYLLGKTDTKELEDIEINDDDIDVAFYEGYKDLEDEDKEVMRNTLKAFLRKNNKK